MPAPLLTPPLAIAGHSGCSLELLDHHVIRKGTTDSAYAPRLRRQIQKQRDFRQWLRYPAISVPAVLRESALVGSGYWAEMEYCAAMDFVQFFLQSGRRDIDQVVATLIAFIETCEKKCTVQRIDGNILQKKFWQVMGKLWHRVHRLPSRPAESLLHLPLRPAGELTPIFLQRCEEWFARHLPQKLALPVGTCHGDLTFSNILIGPQRKQIVLLDFLDCFIETPLQDLVKLRQDSRFHWSFELYRGQFDRTRLAMVMAYIDRQIDWAFRSRPYYAEHYELFQFLNFLRILPYAHQPATIAHALQALSEIMLGPKPARIGTLRPPVFVPVNT